MAKGAFAVMPDEDNPRDIHFKVQVDEGEEIPAEQQRLRDDIARTLIVLRMLYADGDGRFEEYHRRVLSLAQTGLVGDRAQPDLARRALRTLKEEITAREGGRVKNRHMKRLGGWAASFAGVPLVVVMTTGLLDIALAEFKSFALLWAGSMIGVWLSFGARKRVISFEDLHIIEEDRLEPPVRLLFAGFLTILLGLSLSTGALSVALGGIQATQFTGSVEVAVLLGMLCGFTEKALPMTVAAEARNLLPGA